jgi:predicted NUDIX family NTP pyrophosphohydrolase
MPSKSAGVVAFRTRHDRLEVLLVHPGGPYWRNKDLGAWSIPKGEYGADEDAEMVARREFAEELGVELAGPMTSLGEVRQRGGKIVTAFAVELDLDAANIRSNTFEIEWPPRSGRQQTFPEVDRAEWFDLASAGTRINAGQTPLLDRLKTIRSGTR